MMMVQRSSVLAARAAALFMALGVWLAAPAAHAQRITGTIQGKIVRAGEPTAAAKVSATSLTTGAVVDVTTDGDGHYVIAGLPAGQYLIAVKAASDETTDFIELSVGQTLDEDLDVTSISVKGAERIEVSGKRFETRTSEVATEVSQEQLDNLPQSDRNFLNFAQLAPNVRLNSDPLKKNISSAGLGAPATNVFIDGISLKNNINDGGVVGQDSSRGNPFPQLAIQGFRVLTQNYKAEYEQAGSAIVSAVTKSGGNDVHGEFYGSYQDRNISSIDPFAQKQGLQKPDYDRYQVGGLLSGPLIKDKLFAIATYEGNYQDRDGQVTIGNATPDNLARFGKYQGDFSSPFREHLGFAKVTWLPDPAQTVDLTFSIRHETDIRSFGQTTSLENAENDKEDTQTVALRHEWRTSNGFVNEATAQFLNTEFNPTALNPDLVGQDFAGVIRIGGRDTDQDIIQRTVTLRDDLTFPTVAAGGIHQFKVGAKIAFQHYQVLRTQFGNPLFSYRDDPSTNTDFNAPFMAQFGVGNPKITSNNDQIGLYAQDDWRIDRLTLNLGVRWDVETNPLNNNFVTPQNVRDAITSLASQVNAINGANWFPANDYISNGNNRPIFWKEIQPRLGASYDIFGDQKTIAFAGGGVYYDRTLYNTGVSEPYTLQYAARTFQFSTDGLPRNGQPTILWNPAYLSKAGLQGLIDSGAAPNPELDLLNNHTKPPHTDQVSAGVRQQVGPVNLSATFSYIRGEDNLGFYPANRVADGTRDFITVPNFGNVLISEDDIQNRYMGLYVTVEKPFTQASPWSASATYTLGKAQVKGDTFNFDYPRISATPWTPADNDERHRLVLSGIVSLPEQFMASTLMQFGTGLPYNVIDSSQGSDPPFTHFLRNDGRADDFIQFKQIDLRLTKVLGTSPGRMTAFVECFNVFNWYNYGGYDGFIPPKATGMPNPTFGMPSVLVGPTRSFQLGLTYGF